jgi:hypothetical protein
LTGPPFWFFETPLSLQAARQVNRVVLPQRERIVDDPLRKWDSLPDGGGYTATSIWSSVGTHDLDRKLTHLADLYRAAASSQRAVIRGYFDHRRADLDNMWIYVRRVGRLIRSPADIEWLRRGLAIAAIEGGRVDYRDTIVSLVLLRYASERAGIDPRPEFDEAMNLAEECATESFENARDHDDSDVEYTVSAFGPPDWAAEVK